MPASALTSTEICVFDAYGTLYDFNSAVARHRTAIGPKADALSEMWRTKQIQYTWLRNSMGAYAPFWQVTGEALDNCLATFGISDKSVREKLLGAYSKGMRRKVVITAGLLHNPPVVFFDEPLDGLVPDGAMHWIARCGLYARSR